MTDVGSAAQVGIFIEEFRRAVEGRFQVIDSLLDGPAPSSAMPAPSSPPPGSAPTPGHPTVDEAPTLPTPSSSPSGGLAVVQEPTTGISATILNVLVASPGDTADDREVAEDVIREWNSDHAHDLRVILMPQMWETDTYARMGGAGQDQVNVQIADRAEIVIALFRGRLGQPTSNHPSGAAEEIERGIDRGADVHVYVSKEPLPVDIDLKEHERLRHYVADLRSRGLVGSYKSRRDLRRKLRKVLERDVADFLKRSSAARIA